MLFFVAFGVGEKGLWAGQLSRPSPLNPPVMWDMRPARCLRYLGVLHALPPMPYWLTRLYGLLMLWLCATDGLMQGYDDDY